MEASVNEMVVTAITKEGDDQGLLIIPKGR
jgi:hypothetical protein